MLPRVFLPQLVERYDKVKGIMLPAFDFSSASTYGQLTPILGAEDDVLFLARITPKIRKALEDFNDNDYFMAVGDPSVIAICAGIILRRHRTLKMLKWDRKLSLYIQLEINP